MGHVWVSSVVPMARVTQAMHRVTVKPVCALGDLLGTGGVGPERGPRLLQRVTVLLVMSTAGDGRWWQGCCMWCSGRWGTPVALTVRVL